ncbi:hypothetical protein [Marinobacterium marinum]|uniref:Uncharacterized protein n=1 Tax=Marinobacterium marinum TaxID=2756129 RepID=A0A7W2ABV5_9GAMM|nr:hypothetical protein [Marinobacterium marinum]MBA4501839.1 hypothetical protein [Marinobacterium marinum]
MALTAKQEKTFTGVMTSDDSLMAMIRANLIAHTAYDESHRQAFERLHRQGKVGLLMEPPSVSDTPELGGIFKGNRGDSIMDMEAPDDEGYMPQ